MRAIVVFVEGQADAWYVLRSLNQVAGAKFDERKPEQLPTPFGQSAGQGGQSARGLVLSWNERASTGRTVHASAEDNQPVFQVVAQVPPDSTEPRRPELVLVVRMGGDRKAGEVKRLLELLRLSFTSGLNHDVKQLACAFLFDADTPGHYKEASGDCVELRERRFASDYAAELAGAAPKHAVWLSTPTMPLGLFVLHDGATRAGTLEHILEPALRTDPVWGPRIQAAEELLIAHQQSGDLVTNPSGTERAKARITIGGQWNEPGSSLAQIVRRGDPKRSPSVPDGVFASSDAQALVSFLMAVPW